MVNSKYIFQARERETGNRKGSSSNKVENPRSKVPRDTKMTIDQTAALPTSQNSTGSKSTVSNAGRPPTTSVLRSAMYYQNIIIIPDKKRSSHTQNITCPSNTAIGIGAKARPTSLQQNSNSAINRMATNTGASVSDMRTIHGNNANIADDSMESAGIDIVVTDTENIQYRVKKKSLLKRFFLCLQDNRMKGNANAEEILAKSNPAEFVVLKKLLNTTFLSIGIALLVAVVIVIVYSAIA